MFERSTEIFVVFHGFHRRFLGLHLRFETRR